MPRVDDRQVPRGVIFIQRNGLMWKQAPVAHGPPKTPCNCRKRQSRMGVFATNMPDPTMQAKESGGAMIDATGQKPDPTASILAIQQGGTGR